MKRPRALLFALVLPVLLATAAPAQAQTLSVLFALPSGAHVVSQTNLPLHVHGQIVISFHGDPATGCAARGLCPYSGTIVVRPRSGNLAVITYRHHGRIGRSAALDLEPGDSGQYLTAARVARSIPGQPVGTCADTESGSFGGAFARTHGRMIRIALFSGRTSLLSTRCAGPLDADLAAAGPVASIPLPRAARGRTQLDLSGMRSFASHGFAGTITSTLVLSVGRPSKNGTQPEFPPGVKTRRVRTVNVQLGLARLGGHLSVSVLGTSDPLVCPLLDSCGLTGAIALGDVAHGFSGAVSATGPAGRPYRDFLAALGLSASGDPRGISVGIFASWALSPVTARLAQGGTCTDTAPGGGVLLSGDLRRGLLLGGGGVAGLRTRCPGPSLSAENPELRVAIPLRALGRRVFTIRLRPAARIDDEGYTVSLQGALSLSLRRGRVTQQVFTEPVG